MVNYPVDPIAEFEKQLEARRRARVAIYDRLAEERPNAAARHQYYRKEMQRLVSGLILPGSKVLEVGCGIGDLAASLHDCQVVGVDISSRAVEIARSRHPGGDFRVLDVEVDPLPPEQFDLVVLSETVGHLVDVQHALERLRTLLKPEGKIIVTYYNYLWEPLLKLAEKVGYKDRWPEQNWLSMNDVENLLDLSGFEVFRRGTDILLPVEVPLLSTVANRVLAHAPGFRESALVHYFVARLSPEVYIDPLPTVSVICPTKDEKGNIRDAVARTPLMGAKTELIFVDGNSVDGTIEEIEAVMKEYQGPLTLRYLSQGDGKGKGDAVRKGFAAARNDVLMILDSDLTVPPEDLPKFYKALVTGKGNFINGVRLVYPMEDEAMRFLNLLGNKAFSSMLSWLLEQPIKDSLCGTKVLYRRDYEIIAKNREFFGDFDPFGDFDLLFGAARMNMQIRDLPVRYRARVYGDIKISRFAHGWMLAKMTAFGFRKFRLGF